MLAQAIAQLAGWASQPWMSPTFQLHVNLSAGEIGRPGFPAAVGDMLVRAQVPPTNLAVEITETALMTDDLAGLHGLAELRTLGVGLGIDDFGTGYSSISYLRRLPIDMVKVDQSLIRGIASDADQRRFVGAVLRLIESVRLRAIVEGIESAAELAALRQLGCRYGQGHYFSPSMPAEELTELMSRRYAAACSSVGVPARLRPSAQWGRLPDSSLRGAGCDDRPFPAAREPSP